MPRKLSVHAKSKLQQYNEYLKELTDWHLHLLLQDCAEDQDGVIIDSMEKMNFGAYLDSFHESVIGWIDMMEAEDHDNPPCSSVYER